MKREPIKSSQIVSAGYDASSMTLELEFSSTGVYQYDGVPATVYEEFLRAESKGHYFSVTIRGCYPVRVISKKTETKNASETTPNKTRASIRKVDHATKKAT